MMAFEGTCRICGKIKDSTINLYKNKLDNEDLLLHKAFSFVTNLNIRSDDGFPDHICDTCFRRLGEAYLLKRQAEETNLMFENKCKELKVEKECEHHNEDVEQKCSQIRNDLEVEEPVNEFRDAKAFFTEIESLGEVIDNGNSQGSINKKSPQIATRTNRTSKKKVYKNVTNHTCQVCGHNFLRKSNLVDHLRLHANLRPFQCKHCDKSFVQIANFKTHMRIHSNERPYKCHHCNKSFKQSGSLKIHIRFHTQERNYLCNECGKGFTNSSDLSKHKRVHSPDLQFKCGMCEKLFAQKHNLLRHRKRVHSTDLAKSIEERACYR